MREVFHASQDRIDAQGMTEMWHVFVDSRREDDTRKPLRTCEDWRNVLISLGKTIMIGIDMQLHFAHRQAARLTIIQTSRIPT